MLEGTDLFSAYQPLQGAPIIEKPMTPQMAPMVEHIERERAKPIEREPEQPVFNAELFNKQYEQEQRIVHAIQELKRQKEAFNTQLATAQAQQPVVNEQHSYIEKLFSKKKELGRVLQYALIIALGLSIYYLIDEYIKYYINNNDVSLERQIIIKLLYPLSLLFILWNLKVFIR
jgi:hypothetical protein